MNRIGYPQRENVYRGAIESFGAMNQVFIAIEEMSELQKELCKVLRCDDSGSNRHLAEEIADVTIMLEQLRLVFDINEEVCSVMDRKIERLVSRLRAKEPYLWPLTKEDGE